MDRAHAQQLAKECTRAISQQKDKPRIAMVVPKGWRTPKGFPGKRLEKVNRAEQRVFSIRADRLLAWLVGSGLIEVEGEVKAQ